MKTVKKMRKPITLMALSLVGAATAGTAWSQNAAPHAGNVPNYGAIKTVDNAAEKSGKATLKAWGALIDAGKVDEAFSRYVSKDFVDHDEVLRVMVKKQKPGYDDALAMFKKMPEMGGGGTGAKKAFVEQLNADDEMVVVLGRVGQDLYRVVDGKITDHWNINVGSTAPAG